ncbi:hypothetical protein D046_2844B, partial [Vibrio parahaemolyticus V-223/04]
HSRY